MKIINKNKFAFATILFCVLVFACGGNRDKAGEGTGKSSVEKTKTAVQNNEPLSLNAEKAVRPGGDKMVMIIIDALRADALGCYGYDKPTSPTLDKLAAEGILFEQLHSASPWTAPSFGTIFTGVSPTVHGAGGFLARGSSKGTSLFGVTVGGIRSDLPTLPSLMPDNVKTGAIINNSFVCKTMGFAKGFDTFDHENAKLTRYREADKVTDKAVAWLKNNKDNPFFYVVHYFDPHIQYAPPKKYLPEFAPDKPRRISYPFIDHDSARTGKLKPSDAEKSYIRGLYNGEVRFVDDEIARLLDSMKELGLLKNTWIMVTSDHGEEHFDHGSFEHGHRYEEEVVKVPLILRAPQGLWRRGERVKSNVSHVDLLPTVLDIFGVRPPMHLEGRTLFPIIEGKETADRTSYIEYNLFNGQQCAFYDGQYKLVWDIRRKRGFMYDLKNDPKELTRLDKKHPAYAAMIKRLLDKRTKLKNTAKGKLKNKGELSAEATEALKSLGYIR